MFFAAGIVRRMMQPMLLTVCDFSCHTEITGESTDSPAYQSARLFFSSIYLLTV